MKTLKIFVGNPASGKSTIIDKFEGSLNGPRTVFLDCNNYKNWDQIKDGVSQQDIHNVSVETLHRAFKHYVMQDYDIVYEMTYNRILSAMNDFEKIYNRGYSIEIFMIAPTDGDKGRNSKRDFPTPDEHFITLKEFENHFKPLIVNSSVTNNSIFHDINIISYDNKLLYENKTFYKTFPKHQNIGDIITVDGEIQMDTNAIHYADSLRTASIYHSGIVYKVRPIGVTRRCHNVFYGEGVEIVGE